MVQSPSWEANWFAASQQIPRISRNPKVHYRTHKRRSPVSILGQPNPVHIPTSQLLAIHPNIIHTSTPRSPQWSLSLRFPHQHPIHPLSSLTFTHLKSNRVQCFRNRLLFPYSGKWKTTDLQVHWKNKCRKVLLSHWAPWVTETVIIRTWNQILSKGI